MDEAEVVSQLDRGGTRQGALVVTLQRRVGQEAEERPDALAALPATVDPEVVGEHLVERLGV